MKSISEKINIQTITLILAIFLISSCEKKEVLPTISTNFNGDKTTIIVGESVAFTDLTTGEPDSWLWEFSGGIPTTSTSQNPIVEYSQPGSYSVQLTASNADHSDVELKTAFIQVLPQVTASFLVSDTVFIQESTINFTDNSQGEPTEWLWEFEGGTPSTSTEQNPTVSYAGSGVFSVTLTASNSAGSSSITKTIISTPSIGLVAYYPFNGNANDSTGNGNDGALSGGINLTTDRFGNVNSAYEFDGIDDFINTSSTFDYANRTLSLWINPYDISGSGKTTKVAITQDDDALNNGILRVDFQDNQMKLWAGGISGTYTTQSVSPNSWIHLVLIRDADMTYYYVDNVLVLTATADGAGSTINPVPDFIIGAGRTTIDQFFKGKIDDIKVYNRVLNESEVNALYSGY